GAQVIGGGGQGGQDLGGGAQGSGVVLAAGPHIGGPDRPAVRHRDDLYVAAVVGVLARPPEVHAGSWTGRGAPVGLDQRAVDVDVAVAGGLRGQQRPVQARGPGGEHVDALVQIVVGGGLDDRVIAGQLAHTGTVEEPADHQNRLLETAQRAGA